MNVVHIFGGEWNRLNGIRAIGLWWLATTLAGFLPERHIIQVKFKKSK